MDVCVAFPQGLPFHLFFRNALPPASLHPSFPKRPTMNKLAHTAAVLSLTVALGVEAAALSGRQAPAAGAMNNTDNPLSINSYLSEGYTNGSVAPGTWAGDAAGQYVVVNPSAVGVDDNSQVPWCDATIFIGDADVQGNFQTGWQALPSLVNFDLKRDLVVDKAENAVLPYYVERAKDYSKVKRAVRNNNLD